MKRMAMTLVMVIFLTVAALAQDGAKVTGDWNLTLETPMGERKMVMVIKQEGDKLSGAMKGASGQRALDSISLKGDDITFVLTVLFQGADMVITYKGKVEKDAMKGEADFGGLASGNWSAARATGTAAAPATPAPAAAPAGPVNLTGTWNFEVTTSAGSGSPTFTFKQEGETLTGQYKGQLGEGPLTGTVKGGDVKFTVKINFQGQDAELVYEGKLQPDGTLKGTVRLGDIGEGTWTGKKR